LRILLKIVQYFRQHIAAKSFLDIYILSITFEWKVDITAVSPESESALINPISGDKNWLIFIKHEVKFVAEEIITRFNGALYTLGVVKQ